MLTLLKQRQNFAQVYNGDESCLQVNKTNNCKFKTNDNII